MQHAWYGSELVTKPCSESLKGRDTWKTSAYMEVYHNLTVDSVPLDLDRVL